MIQEKKLKKDNKCIQKQRIINTSSVRDVTTVVSQTLLQWSQWLKSMQYVLVSRERGHEREISDRNLDLMY